jgi:hypothetical protein
MPHQLIAGLMVTLIAVVIMISTAISCMLLTKTARTVGLVNAIVGWCTFIVLLIALIGSISGFIMISEYFSDVPQ